MPVITSISGIRGTIGGTISDSLNPLDIVKFTTAYGNWVKTQKANKPKIVIGRDARISGEMVDLLVTGTLIALGIDVLNLGMATTPTVEIAVIEEHADGGIIITASHNPKNWNALKLLNQKGEFLSKANGELIFKNAKNIENIKYADVNDLGKVENNFEYVHKHIELIKKLPLVDLDAIKKADFKVAVDCINSVGAVSVPVLLKELGVSNVWELNNTPNGNFAHNPEPLPENLTDISELVKNKKADVGFVVDPDVDRLAIINEDGTMFGEEYTLVAIADYVLANRKGDTVSNLSSSMALADIAKKHGRKYFATAVGELNVVEKMKAQKAVIGGEGNGGVIYPKLHYGRDALVGIALFLSHLAKANMKTSELRNKYPKYEIVKLKKDVTGLNVDEILKKIKKDFAEYKPITIDGVKINFKNGWVHLRKSNTEPIIRIYAESKTKKEAEDLAKIIINNELI